MPADHQHVGRTRVRADGRDHTNPERAAALDHDFLTLLTRSRQQAPSESSGRWQAEYLLVTALKR